MNIADLPSTHDILANVDTWTSAAAPYLTAASPVALAAWLWWAIRRARLIRAALGDRATVEVVPTSTFDPSEGEVGRWARQLGRVHHAAGGVSARGSAARLRYSAEDSKMRCYLEGPATAAAVLAMPGFAEVEVRAHRAQKDIQPVRFPAPREGPGRRHPPFPQRGRSRGGIRPGACTRAVRHVLWTPRSDGLPVLPSPGQHTVYDPYILAATWHAACWIPRRLW